MRKLKDRIKNETLKVVGAHDALTAQLIKEHNFDGIWVGGFGLATVQGVPDANILTMTEVLGITNKIADKVHDIPIIVDCDSGFGGIHNVARMVKSFEKIGADAVCIEDKPFPKINSFAPVEQKLIPREEFCKMIRVAKDSQSSNDFLVIARTEALIVGEQMDRALERAYAYEESGADAILIHSKSKSPDEVMEFSNRWEGNVPLVIVPTTYPQISFEDIKRQGNIGMVIYANQILRKYLKSIDEFLFSLKVEDSIDVFEKQISPVQEVFDIQGLSSMIELEKKYTENVPLKR